MKHYHFLFLLLLILPTRQASATWLTKLCNLASLGKVKSSEKPLVNPFIDYESWSSPLGKKIQELPLVDILQVTTGTALRAKSSMGAHFSLVASIVGVDFQPAMRDKDGRAGYDIQETLEVADRAQDAANSIFFQYPALRDVQVPKSGLEQFLRAQERRFGTHLPVITITNRNYYRPQ